MAVTTKEYTQSGSTTNYSFPFPYIKQTDVKVNLDNVPTEAFTYANATTIQLNSPPAAGTKILIYRETSDANLTATFYPGSAIRSGDLNDNFTQNLYSTQENTNDANEALDNSRVLVDGAYVSAITRATEAETTADAADNIADAAKLATDTYVHDGTSLKGDGIGGNPQGVKYAVVTATDAATDAATAIATANGADTIADKALDATDTLVATKSGSTWTLQGDGAGSNPKGVKYAVEKADEAITDSATALSNSRNTADPPVSAIDLATTASNNASNAVTTANTARDNAVKQDGVTPPGGANAAITIAEDAYDNAVKQDGVTPSGGSNAAITIAESAETAADAAKLATDRLVATTSDGGSTWTLTGGNTNASTDPKGVKYAVETAEAAQASVAASAIYKLTSNLTSLTTDGSGAENFPLTSTADPSNAADDGTYVQITDSTGISLDDGTWSPSYFSGAGSFPNGFDGHSQLTLRVKVSNSSAGSETYIAQEYYANDPEARYGEDRKVIVENNRTLSANYTIQTTMNAHSVGPVTLEHNGTDLAYDASTYVVSNDATAGYTVTIPENSTWLIS